MTRDNKPPVPTEKRNEYAFWEIPNAPATVLYSLPVFHEIDFTVNEGYRKIPHGGIEEGGLLFGKIDEKGTRIEAFRPIQCEHAEGPSFLLSARDLEGLSGQLAGSATDLELAGLDPVGWFLAHTRSPLVLTEREFQLCERYFSRPGMLTVLVKPERFQPTRFGFLVRAKDGSLPRDAAQNAVILPLPGRNVKTTNGPIASIPAPAVSAAAARRALEAESQESDKLAEDVPASTPAEEAIAKEPAAPAAKVATPVSAPEPTATPVVIPPPIATPASEAPAENRAARRQRRLSLDQVTPKVDAPEKVAEVAVPPSVKPGPPPASVETPAPVGGELEPVRAARVPSPERMLALRQTPLDEEAVPLAPDPYRQIELLNKKKPASTAARFVMVLPLAALLGCLVGYIAYLQVPSPVIPLTVKGRGDTVIVSWPADQTRSAVYAAVRVDDNTPVMLTPEERVAGRVEISASTDMKVELIARNWIHDSRGIVRFIKPLANTGK
jgi:hypothetical protein